mmetsp:Transcript_24556/g.48830  ORF Transcript_24556/g.48830 Transcript_24556/m.48830 type:complete len:390 (+) Transcript_24556:173-1342(+)|eukprot:CAMPEP_0171348486 /NCGR_PEP_ID=MMETSP0878-20121228/30992_1 /TAXON_ID=67004 /ORGANISM="Thalassiosira weissflogii, Strain CCMP1336" /LENGTH=389 /DNA_ID=CAMNT_0011852845 /DNA_START=128 /DNA_END=1297 /DNA_ORIENTATION=+
MSTCAISFTPKLSTFAQLALVMLYVANTFAPNSIFASAFSYPPRNNKPPFKTHPLENHRNCRLPTTQLNEQPVSIKKILGPISPATLDNYNLPPSTISEGWAAQIVTKTAKSLDETTEIQLCAKNAEENYVDSFRVDIPIPLDQPSGVGLGIELLEIEGGGREDGLGIVIVNGLVSEGNAERAVNFLKSDGKESIMYGDSIASADLILKRKKGSIGENMEILTVRTECLNYDSMVEALGGLLSPLNEDNNKVGIDEATVVLTLKRLRRRPKIQIKLNYPPSQNLPPEILELKPGDNLRMAMLTRGIKLKDPLAQRYDGKPTGSGNCGSGGLCRTCAISVRNGGDLLSPPKENEKKMLEATPRWRLACKSWVGYGMKEGEITIDVNPRQW